MAYDKVVDSAVLDGYFSDIADAIRDKDGTQNTYTPAQMPQAIEDIPSGGGDEALMALLSGTATGEVIISGIERCCATFLIDSSSTGKNNQVTALRFPDLKTASRPPILGTQAYNAAALEIIDMPELTNLSNGLDTSGGYYTFRNVVEVNTPKLIQLPTGFINYFSGLEKFTDGVCNYIGVNAFRGCSAIKYIDLGKTAATSNSPYVQSQAFQNCSALVALVLRWTRVASLGGTSVFSGTPIASGTGYIYVPRDLVATYQAATNWSTYSTQFRALEDYTDDGTITGEFIMPTT